MSQSITVIGIFRNNKRVIAGLYNRHNNRPFNETERQNFMDMLDERINSQKGKFKSFQIRVRMQSGDECKVYDLGAAFQILKADPFLKPVDRDEWQENRY